MGLLSIFIYLLKEQKIQLISTKSLKCSKKVAGSDNPVIIAQR